MKLLLLVNPQAGRKKGQETADQAVNLLRQKGHQVETRFTKHARQMYTLAAAAVQENWDGIVAVGGDGTLFEVINGMMSTNPALPIPLGTLPVGTGNSFSRDLQIRDFAGAVEKISNGQTRRVDLGQYDSSEGTQYFINLLGFGFVADVAQIAQRYKRLGALSYAIGVLIKTIRLEIFHLELEIDGRRLERENCFVEICNSQKTGGDMLIAPQAKIDDGLLDVIILNRISRIGVLKAFPKIFDGTHLDIPECEFYQAKQIIARPATPKILTPDGEVRGFTPITVSVLPQKIAMFA
ncbi:diacylglycerol kinase family lipid kinase [candidate division KSB1 bacterium]|nr:diacylglycerol kinase family lipid kinase [candidate division KSB1 bacterium]